MGGGYWDLSVRPWDAQKDLFETLSGGKNTAAREPMTDAAQLPTLATFPLDVPGGFNPSIVMWQGRLVAMVRTVQHGATVNFFGEVQDRRLVNPKRVNEPRGFKSAWGIEDCRLFVMDNSLWAVATYGQGGSTQLARGSSAKKIGHALAKMVIGRLDPNGNFEFGCIQESPRHEKNWSPIVDQVDGKDRLRFLYAVNAPVVTVWDGSRAMPPAAELAESTGHLRGGSQVIPYKDGWLTVAHGVANTKGKMYTHRFVSYDKGLTSAKEGRPFYFQHRGCEFCAGMARLPGGDFALSYGVTDDRAFVAEVATDTVDEFLDV